MSNYFYAEIDPNSIVQGVSELNGPVNAPHMIRIDSYDLSLVGKRYENSEFVSVPAPAITVISKDAFRQRTTIDEQIRLETGIQAGNVDLIIIDKTMRDTPDVDVKSDRMQWVMAKFIEHGVVDNQARADELLRDGTPEEAA